MKFRWLLTAAVAASMVAVAARADDKSKKEGGEDDAAQAMSKLAQLGPGVQKIKADDKGRIQRLVVVGQAQINTSLGATIGIQTARKKAVLNAKAEMVRFLKEKVAAYLKSEEEVVFFQEGSENNDKDEIKNSGKRVEKNTERMESIAEGVVRGLQLLHAETVGKDKTYTVVLGWDARVSAATLKVKAALESDEPKGAARFAVSEDEESKHSGGKTVKKIEDKKATSREAKKFLED
jgi:hypothetical protein